MKAFNSLSQEIQVHLKEIAKTSGLPLTNESYERLAAAWLEKLAAFEAIMADNGLVEASQVGKDDAKGALALTWSGSIINVGPLVDGTRRCEYTSIGLRADVPASALEEASTLEADLTEGESLRFGAGPIKLSSPVYRIAVTAEALEPAEEEALLTQVTQDLAEDFVEINKTVIEER